VGKGANRVWCSWAMHGQGGDREPPVLHRKPFHTGQQAARTTLRRATQMTNKHAMDSANIAIDAEGGEDAGMLKRQGVGEEVRGHGLPTISPDPGPCRTSPPPIASRTQPVNRR
jgi:hypothetical protein